GPWPLPPWHCCRVRGTPRSGRRPLSPRHPESEAQHHHHEVLRRQQQAHHGNVGSARAPFVDPPAGPGVPSKWSRYASPAFNAPGSSSDSARSISASSFGSAAKSTSPSVGALGSSGSNASGLTVSSSRLSRAIAPKFGSPLRRAGTVTTIETLLSSFRKLLIS